MKPIILLILRMSCTLTGVGCHCVANINNVYQAVGFNEHLLPLVVAIAIVYVLIALKEFNVIEINSKFANLALDVIEIILQSLIVVPLFFHNGHIVDLANMDITFWYHVLVVAGGIALLRVVLYILHNTTIR